MSFPDVTADLLNVLLYGGKRMTEAANLLPGPTETIYQGRARLRSQYEDLCKYEMKNGRIQAMYLIANQSRVDGKMVLRKAGYTGGAYREQYEGKTRDFYPVIQIVLYWGNGRWRSSRDLRHLLRRQELPRELWGYVDELRLHVFEMRHLPRETRELFQSDMRIVADYLAEGTGYRSGRRVRHKAALVRMLRALSGEREEPETIERELKEKGIREEDEITMCELFDQYTRAGRQEGLKEGMQEGEARRLVFDVEKLMKNLHLTLEKACEVFEISVGNYEDARRLL